MAASSKWMARSGDRNLVAEIDILNRIQDGNAVLHRSLECLATRNQTGTAGALVNNSSGDGFFEVILSGGPARINQSCASHVAIGHLVASQVDRVIGGQFGVDSR